MSASTLQWLIAVALWVTAVQTTLVRRELSVIQTRVTSPAAPSLPSDTIPSTREILQALTEMLVSTPADVKQPVIKGVIKAGPIVAVIVDPPYREYPNVIFFTHDDTSGNWRTEYEALSLGLMDYVGPLLDLHTVNAAADMSLENDASRGPMSADPIESTAERIAVRENMAIVHYANFEHMHGPVGVPYMIDKRSYTTIGAKEVNPRYASDYSESAHGCTMYDTPLIKKATFRLLSRGYELKAEAPLSDGSVQKWTVRFTGFTNGRIVEKQLSVTTQK